MEVLWWYWLVGGFALIVAELAVPAFFLIWFGLAGLMVGLVAWLVPTLGLNAQILVWLSLSVALLVAWLKIFRKDRHRSTAGMSSAIEGEIGLLIRDVASFQTGQVRFQRPVLGADVWECQSEVALRAGSRVRVLAVEGRLLKVSAA